MNQHPTRIWTGLTTDQTDGLACVICHQPLTDVPASRPVGTTDDGRQVFACDHATPNDCTHIAHTTDTERGTT